MSGGDGNELPKGLDEQDRSRVQEQVDQTNIDYFVKEFGLGSLANLLLGGHVAPGTSNFEGHELNDMIDLVENANPEHLETAGKTLLDAKRAIDSAAGELTDHILAVDWEGEGAEAFRTWGNNLVSKTYDLSAFADAAGIQITSAGSGLASVRGAMPPRDKRLHRKKISDIPVPEQIDGNPDYDAAKQVEQHRQEAINQMNRLASFYKVSESNLAAQEPPTFDAMPNLGVPQPDRSIEHPGGPGDRVTSHVKPHVDAVDHSDGDVTGHGGGDDLRQRTPIREDMDVAPPPVNTEIDSVDAPPIPTAPQHTGPQNLPTGVQPPPTTTTPPPFTGPFSPSGGRFPANYEKTGPTSGPLGRTPPQRLTGGGGDPENTGRQSPTGRPPMGRSINSLGRMSQNASENQRTQSPTGRPPTGRPPMGRSINSLGRMNQSNLKSGGSSTGRDSSTNGRPPMGRPVSGGTPRQTNGSKPPRTSPMGLPKSGKASGRSESVIGGKSNAPGQRTPGSKVPKGNVVGGQNSAVNGSSRPGAIPNNKGVIGAQRPVGGSRGQLPPRPPGSSEGVSGSPQGRAPGSQAPGRGQLPPRPQGSSEGVSGSPRGRTSGARGGARGGFTEGGSGLARNSGRKREREDESYEYEDEYQRDFQLDDTSHSDPEEDAQRRHEQGRDVPPHTD